MKRNEGCEKCSWNFGRHDDPSQYFPCQLCESHDLYIEFPYDPSKDKALQRRIQKLITGIVGATCLYLIYKALEGVTLEHAEIQQENNAVDEL